MKIKSLTSFVILLIITISLMSDSKSLLNSSSFSNKNSNSNKNTKFEIGANLNLQNNLKTKATAKLSISNSFENLINFTIKERLGGFPPVIITNSEIGKGPLYYDGWGKLMKLQNPNEKKYIRDFEHNKKNKYHKREFYFTLNNKMLSAYTSDKNILSSNFANIPICDIYPIDLSTKYVSGGVKDLGNFKEGFCTEITGLHENSPFNWVICSKSYEEKSNFVNNIAKLKLKDQGIKTKINNSLSSHKIRNGLYNIIPKKALGQTGLISKPGKPEARWITLKDWGDCTLACGGGYRYKHRYCYIPEGAEPCTGEAILKKPCNEQPCNEINIPELNKGKKGIETEIMPIQVKVVQVSNRRQKYIRCVIKEEDLSIIRTDLSDSKSHIVKLPSRIVINNKSLSIFQSDNVESLFKSFNLKDLKVIKPYKKEPEKCVEIGTLRETTVLCSLSEINSKKPNEFIQKWIFEINDFKNNCQEKEKKVPENYLKNPEVLNFINQLQEKKLRQNLEKFHSARKVENIKNSSNDFRKKLKIAQILAWKAMDKELKYEERLEKEELLREQKEKEKVNFELIVEQKKKDKICQAISFGKKTKSENIKKEIEYNKQIEQIKHEIQDKLIFNRKKFHEKIHKMQKAHERKIMQTQSQITEIRKTLTTKLIKADKKGDGKKCKRKTTIQYRVEYCDGNFVDDVYYNAECKKEKEFCSLCCENEFGELHQVEMEKCLVKCEIK